MYEVQATHFAQQQFRLASSETEQIAVQDVLMALRPDESRSAHELKAPLQALKLLREKLNFIISAVENSAELRRNHDFMRRLN